MKRIVKGALVRRNESGFTLIEMLIVVGIIVALAAAVVPTVVRQASKGAEGSKASEAANVQAAFDTLMAEKQLTLLDAQATSSAIRAWTAEPTINGGTAEPLSPDFLRDTATKWGYCWTANGQVTQTATDVASDVTCVP